MFFSHPCFRIPLLAGITAAALIEPTRGAPASAPIANWTFDEQNGNILEDHSGTKNHGTLHGPTFVEDGRNRALRFDGRDDFVDCGNNPGLNLTRAVTVRAWIYPDVLPAGEVGLIVKHDISAFGLTYYRDGRCWWYIAGGGNSCKASVGVGGWHQVTGTYDGKIMRLYVDGEPKASKPLNVQIPTNGNLAIGKWPATGRCFAGKIDDVRIYDRALTSEEIREAYRAEAGTLMIRRPRIQDGTKRTGKEFTLRVAPSGRMQIEIGHDAYFVESGYSHPGARIGWNRLADENDAGETSWLPKVTGYEPNGISIEAVGTLYTLQRRITVDANWIDIQDTLANVGKDDVGIIVRNLLIADDGLTDTFPEAGATSSENPTLLLTKKASSLGLLLEDDVARLQGRVSASVNQASVTIGNVVLPPGGAHTFRWSLFPRSGPADYFAFIRTIRKRWASDFPIQGPFAFFDVTDPRIDDPDALRSYLRWKRLKIVALSPWLDYDPGIMDHVLSRDEYKRLIGKAVRAFKQVDPDIRCLGCIETDWATINPADIPDGEKLPRHGGGHSGNVELSPEQTRIIDNAHIPWHDSFKRKPNGNLVLELYSRGGKPQTAIWVYPEVGNHHYTFLLGQVKFLLDEVGLDGFYIDEFSQAWRDSERTYNKRFDASTWDLISGDIDPATGKITGKYVDCSLVGIQARVNLCKYALDRGKIVVANTYATSVREQPLPVHRFSETLWHFDPARWTPGQKPSLVSHLFRSHLDSPIGLGIHNNPNDKNLAERLNKALVIYLRHGMLYYHYALPDPPRNNNDADDSDSAFGPINHMFPITPANFGEGFIQGPERILSCVSRRFVWPHGPRPTVTLFDLSGRRVNHAVKPKPRGKQWIVDLKLEDWKQIGVVTGPRPKYAVDLDGDGDVDDEDFKTFTNCFNGPNHLPRVDCRNYFADLDDDNDVDNDDLLRFSNCFNGSGNPPKPACREKIPTVD